MLRDGSFGRLCIRGRAPDLVFEWTARRPVEIELDADAALVSHVEEPQPPRPRARTSSLRSHMKEPQALGSRTRASTLRSHAEESRRGPTAAMKTDAALALKTLGYSRPIARAAVERGCERIEDGCDLEALLRAALQCVS